MGRCAPEASQADPPRSWRRPAPPPSGPRRLWSTGGSPELCRPRALCGAGPGPGAGGTPWHSQVEERRAGAATSHPAPQTGWQRRAPFGGRSAAAESRAAEGEQSSSPLRPPRPGRGQAGRTGAIAGLRAPVPALTLSAPVLPGAEWPGTWTARGPVRPLAYRCLHRQAGAAQLGSLDAFSPFPPSLRVELETRNRRGCAPINSARVPASRSPSCARAEKVVRRDWGARRRQERTPPAELPCTLPRIRTFALSVLGTRGAAAYL